MQQKRYDLVIVGAGIVGLATAYTFLQRKPGSKLLVLEKESEIGLHQTGHNSGVIHSGIYYKPGSLKAKTCMAGQKKLLEFCTRQNIAYKLCGKVIVAVTEDELSRLEELFRRGSVNGVPQLEMIGPERLRELEPCVAGIRALYSPTAGIVDFGEVARAYARAIRAAGGEIKTSTRAIAINTRPEEVVIETSAGEIGAKYLINCAGLYSDKIAKSKEVQIIPFRGEYYRLSPAKDSLVKALIYPVPDPRFPFLGVHFTRNIRGYVEAGPNAVLALAREGYAKSDINTRELWETLSFKGFRAVAGRYWKTGLAEMYRSLCKRAFTKALRRLIPELREEDLVAGGSGVRAQAVRADGTLIDDFEIIRDNRSIHVINAPSPAATASLAIGEAIVNKLLWKE